MRSIQTSKKDCVFKKKVKCRPWKRSSITVSKYHRKPFGMDQDVELISIRSAESTVWFCKMKASSIMETPCHESRIDLVRHSPHQSKQSNTTRILSSWEGLENKDLRKYSSNSTPYFSGQKFEVLNK